MPRKMIVVSDDGPARSLGEVLARDEAQLQETMKANPDLLPIDEFGIAGPLMVVGRETPLPSGAVDLVALARSGEILIVEFKTGPQNPDFRAVLAQLLDYGSDLWRMTVEGFEQAVAVRYFTSAYCAATEFKGQTSLELAARVAWPGFSAEEAVSFRETMAHQLLTGAFHYVAVAQRFVPSVLRTIEYLNATMPKGRFYAVEMVRFTGEGLSAFEARTLLRPDIFRPEARGDAIDEIQFLDSLADDGYRDAVREFLDFCRGFGLTVYRGSAGMSLRVAPGGSGPLMSIGWLFPPGRSGWMGLLDTNFGYDEATANRYPMFRESLDAYVAELSLIPDATSLNKRGLKGSMLRPTAFMDRMNGIKGSIARLVQSLNQSNSLTR